MPTYPSRQPPAPAAALGALLAGALMATLAAPRPAAAQRPPSDSLADARALALIRDSVPAMMKRMSIPGTVVTVVRGDRILMNQGFGLADVARNTPVDPNRTVFRTASVAKVFTALAALRLHATGRLPLQADISRWVPEVDLGASAAIPITVEQLLTHTAGIDERLLGYLNAPGAPPPPLAEWATKHMPERTRLPDASPAYSNHGYALVGLIAERITSVPFDAFVRDSIFLPLGMRQTGFLMRPGLDSVDHAVEYHFEGTVRVQRSSAPYPAGNLASTGADMAAFLRALLNPRRDSALSLLLAPVVRYHPEMPPMGYVLSALDMNGRQVLMKGGSGPSHAAVIAVIPGLDLGIFIAVNRQEPTLWDKLVPEIVRAYGPAQGVAAAPSGSVGSPGTLPRLDGDFLWMRAGLGSWEKILGIGTQIRVRTFGDSVEVTGPFMEGRYGRDGEHRFRRADRREIAFRVDSAGSASRMFSIIVGQPTSFERIPLHRTTRFQLGALAGGSALALAAGFLTLRRNPVEEAQPSWARMSTIALPAAQLVTVGTALFLSQQGDQLFEGPTSGLYATMSMTTVTAIAGLMQAAGSATLAGRAKPMGVRATYALSAGAGVAFTWFLASNNLIGFRF